MTDFTENIKCSSLYAMKTNRCQCWVTQRHRLHLGNSLPIHTHTYIPYMW